MKTRIILTVNEKPEDFLVINEENKEQEHFTGEASNAFINEEAMDSEVEIGLLRVCYR